MSLEGKRILVTGGSGFIGSNVIKALDNMGAKIVATLHIKPRQYKQFKNVEWKHVDLRNTANCDYVCEDVDYVILCAANTSGANVIERAPLTHLTPNVIMNTLMLEAAYKAGVKKVLFISSSTVYPLTDYPVTEKDDGFFCFYDKYYVVGWMKRFSELMCEMYGKKIPNPMTTIVIRPSNIYGPMDDFNFETAHVVPALIRRVVEGQKPLTVWGDGSDVKDLLYIDDLVNGVLLAVDKTEHFDTFNISTGHGTSVKETIEMIAKLCAFEGSIEYDTTKPMMIPFRLVDCSKAKKVLGYKPSVSLEEGLQRTIDWYKGTL